jgi:hypothetical protein
MKKITIINKLKNESKNRIRANLRISQFGKRVKSKNRIITIARGLAGRSGRLAGPGVNPLHGYISADYEPSEGLF